MKNTQQEKLEPLNLDELEDLTILVEHLTPAFFSERQCEFLTRRISDTKARTMVRTIKEAKPGSRVKFPEEERPAPCSLPSEDFHLFESPLGITQYSEEANISYAAAAARLRSAEKHGVLKQASYEKVGTGRPKRLYVLVDTE